MKSSWGVTVLSASVAAVATPVLRVIQVSWPPRLSDVSWRYGVVGLFADASHLVVLGVFGACVAAVVWGSRRWKAALSMAALALALITALLCTYFVWNARRWAADLPAEALDSFWRDTGAGILALVLGVAAMGLLGVVTWRRRDA